MMVDLLALRRALIVEVCRLVAPRTTPASTAAARVALTRAWAARDHHARFQEEDFQVMRAIVEGAGFLPAVWMLNRLSGVYLECARAMSGAFKPPADYIEAHTRFLDALERGDADTACKTIADYLERHDRALVSALEVFA
jgi:DNA-binding FadR family transcriptional regulator